MSLGHGSSIVRSGLVLHLDAANPKSYPGSGTVWRDLSGLGNNGTLVNGVGYNNANNGSIVFDGVNDYSTVSYNPVFRLLTSTTINFWYYPVTSSGYMLGYAKSGWTGYIIGPTGINYSGQSGSNDFSRSITSTLNQWQMFTWVIDRTSNIYTTYQNSIQTNNGSITHPSVSDVTSLYIGARGVPDNFYNGRVSNLIYYNRALSAAEIKQNFEALRGRYGI